MNDTPQHVGSWLEQHQQVQTAGLDHILDVEAGLREVLLQSHHDAHVHKLDTVLDSEAGLADILPTPRGSTSDVPANRAREQSPLHPGEYAMQSVSPVERMALRASPRVRAAVDHTDVAANFYRVLVEIRAGGSVDATGMLAQCLHDAVGLGLAVIGNREGRTAALLQDVLEKSAELRHLTPARRRSSGLDAALALGVARALSIAGRCMSDFALDRRATYDNNDLITAISDLDDAVRKTRNALAHLRGFPPTRDHDAAFAEAARESMTLRRVCTATAKHAIEVRLRRRLPSLNDESLHALLEDFVTADLRRADLSGIDLTGVRWSDHGTQWPNALDIDDLRALSEETPAGSGIYVVQSGTATVYGYADLT